MAEAKKTQAKETAAEEKSLSRKQTYVLAGSAVAGLLTAPVGGLGAALVSLAAAGTFGGTLVSVAKDKGTKLRGVPKLLAKVFKDSKEYLTEDFHKAEDFVNRRYVDAQYYGGKVSDAVAPVAAKAAEAAGAGLATAGALKEKFNEKKDQRTLAKAEKIKAADNDNAEKKKPAKNVAPCHGTGKCGCP